MLNILLLTVGNLPKGPYTHLGDDFLKQLQKYATVKVREYKDTTSLFTKSPSADAFLLDECGETMASVTFAELLQSFEDRGDTMTFILGGPDGFSDEIKKKYTRLSLSPMTTTHDIARIFLLEQLFRGMSIVHGSKYHRG